MSVCFDHELLDPRGPSWNGGWERWRRKDISVTYDAFIKKLVYCWTPCIFCVWDQSGAERIPSCQLKKKEKPYPEEKTIPCSWKRRSWALKRTLERWRRTLRNVVFIFVRTFSLFVYWGGSISLHYTCCSCSGTKRYQNKTSWLVSIAPEHVWDEANIFV